METTLYKQFAQGVANYPHQLCLCDENSELTYQQTLKLALNLAYSLKNEGLHSNAVVALNSPKNIESVIYFLALSYIGATVLTLDLSFPEKVTEFIIKDANVKFLIHQQPIKQDLPTKLLTFKHLHEIQDLIDYGEEPLSQAWDDSSSIAWIVYSSGTTGNPKGIAIQNSAILNSIFSRFNFSDYKHEDKVLCSIYFYWEVFRPIFKGAAAYLISEQLLLNIPQYLNLIAKFQITETLWTPSFAQMLLQCICDEDKLKLTSLKRVWLNGEVVLNELKDNLVKNFPEIDFFNLYSISETFDVAAQKLNLENLDNNFASIGKPFSGVSTWVLDENRNICPANTPGELYVASSHLAQGYLNQPQLTNESFLKLPHVSGDCVLFKTKDTAYKNDKDEIVIMGRNDHIVKLRGYNVSVLAVEDVIKKIFPVSECVVAIEGTNQVNQILTAHILPKDRNTFINEYNLCTKNFTSLKLQKELSLYLPFYAIPTKFLLLDDIILNDYSQKLDRKQIVTNNTQYKDTSDNEGKLKNLWHKIFRADFSDSDKLNLLNLGANSLEIMQYTQMLNKTFNISIGAENIFNHPEFLTHLQWINGQITNSADTFAQIAYDTQITIDPKVINFKAKITANINKAKKVLITGVTGFLGVHWLHHLLQNTNCEFYCLVRAQSTEAALHKLKQQMKYYQLEAELNPNRVKIITGSLEELKLGLATQDWETLGSTIDVILHAGAIVNLLKPYQLLKQTTVTGTQTLLELALLHKIKPFVLISSDAVFGAAEKNENFLHKDTIKTVSSGYGQTKWAQEELLQNLLNQINLPYVIFRLGNLGPSTISGTSNPTDTNNILLQFIFKHKVLPETLKLEFTPVDRTVEYITNCISTGFNNKIYNITNLNVLNAKDIQVLTYKLDLKIISNATFKQLLSEINPMLSALYDVDDMYIAKGNDDVNNDLKYGSLRLNQQELVNVINPSVSSIKANQQNLQLEMV